LPYRVRCNLPDCGKPSNHVFKKEMGGMMNTFCSPAHASLGEERWDEKKDIRLGVQPEPEEQMVGDNIEEVNE